MPRRKTSFNKFFKKTIKKVFDYLDPVLEFFGESLGSILRIVAYSGPVPTTIQPTNVPSPILQSVNAKPRSKASSSGYANAWSNKYPSKSDSLKRIAELKMQQQNSKRASFEKAAELKMTQKSSDKNEDSNQLSPAMKKLLKDIELAEWREKSEVRPEGAQIPSQVLGKKYVYGEKQLGRKLKHLTEAAKALGFTLKASPKDIEGRKIELLQLAEHLLTRPGLVTHLNGTFNPLEPARNFGDPQSKIILGFDNTPFKNLFIIEESLNLFFQ